MKKKALLVIGEEKISRTRPYVSFQRFIKYARRLRKRDIEVHVIDYARIFSGRVPSIDAPIVKIVFFFPYRYWNRHIEVYADDRFYGDKRFGREFKAFFKRAKRAIERYFPGKRIEYLNSPQLCYLDRDKKASKDLLKKSAVSVPRTFQVSSFEDVQRLLNRGTNLYIKPRFGSMGKGITYINNKEAISNFLFRKNKVLSRPSDFNWRFSRIS